MNRHYETWELVEYERGMLGTQEANDLLAHCQACQECGTRLAMVIGLRKLGRRQRRARRQLLAVGVAVVAVVAAGLIWYSYNPVSPGAPARTAETDQYPGRLAAYATTELPDPTYPLLRFHDAFLVAADNEWLSRVKAAVEALWAGELDSSTQALRELRSERPNDPEIAAYLGISLYLSGEHGSEVEALLEEGATGYWLGLRRYSLFYLANDYLLTGRDSDALALLRDLETGLDGAGEAAKRLLERLPSDAR